MRQREIAALLGAVLTIGLSGGAAAEIVDPAGYDALLRRYVRDGCVDYAGLKGARPALDAYLEGVASADPNGGSREARLAFWLNAYNATTLRLVLDHYPLRRTTLAGFLHPSNSIRQIPGAWEEPRLGSGARVLSLDSVLHQILRERFHEVRVHFAVVPATRGAAKLAAEAFVAERLEAQLESVTRSYLADNEHGLRVDLKTRTVWLSKLFDWYGRDFVLAYAESPVVEVEGISEVERAVLSFIYLRLSEPERELLDQGNFRVRYLPYDWSLNE